MKLSRRVIRVVDKTTFSRTNVFFALIAKLSRGLSLVLITSFSMRHANLLDGTIATFYVSRSWPNRSSVNWCRYFL